MFEKTIIMNEPTNSQKYETVIRKLHSANMWTTYQTEAHFYEETIGTVGGIDGIKGHLYMALAYRKSIDHKNEDRKKKLTELQLQVHITHEDINSLVNDILSVLTDPNY